MFEWLFVAGTALSLLDIFVLGRGAGGVDFLAAGAAVVLLVLALFASRRRSNVARWILAVLTGLSLVGAGYLLSRTGLGGAGFDALGLVASVLQVAAVAMLFRPEAAGWFARRDLTVD